jgi:RHS repeat-associated protein
MVTISDPLGIITSREYDPVSRLVREMDPRGKTTTFAYDALNRPISIIDALGGGTAFTYNPNGNLLTVTDARGNTVSHEYDAMDRLSQRIDQLGRAETHTYDGNGNLVSTTDRKGQTSTFEYDAVDRRLRALFADGTVAAFTYDAAGRLIQTDDTADPHRPITRQYDALDRLLAETTALGTVSYQYDALGRRTQMTVSGQAPVAYTYDAASRLRGITQSPLNPVTFDYDALGRRTLLTLPNGVSTEYQYDPASRLTALVYRNALGILGDLTYQYDPAGNRIRVGGSFARTLLPDAIPTATYDAANRQLIFGGKTMSFDENGNLGTLTDGAATTTLSWDPRNRLSGLGGIEAASYAYDFFGRRVRRLIGGTSTEYRFDRLDVVGAVQNGAVVAYGRTLQIDDLLYRTEPGGSMFYLREVLGSTVALVNGSGNLAINYAYEPFGRTVTVGAASGDAFQFTGRENDGPPELYFFRARYYHTGLHRFLSEDPIRRYGGTDSGYVYVENQPTNLVDPDGQIPLVVPILLLGGAFGAAEQAIIAIGHGQSLSEIARQTAIGFGAGAIGAGTGVLVGLLTKNPALVGAATNAVYGIVVRGANGEFSMGQTIADAGIGALAGPLARRVVPKVPGPEPNIFAQRPLSKYGPKSFQLLKQAGLGGELGVIGGYRHRIVK